MQTATELQDATWDIETLVEGRGEAGADQLLTEATERARKLESHRGGIAQLDPAGLAALMDELGAIRELIGRASAYSELAFSKDAQDEKAGALMQKVSEQATQIGTMLLFFELEWTSLEDQRAEELLADPRLDRSRHYLKVLRRFRDYRLSEPEERILAEKSLSARASWARLFSELTAAITVDIEGETVSFEEAASRLQAPTRSTRKATAEGITAALAPGLRTRGFIYNTLLQDKATDDRLRGYEHWLRGFNMSQEASDEAVAALVEAVRGRYDLPQRWYRVKAKVLGIDKLADYDRIAPVTEDTEEMDWVTARDMVVDCYSSFSQELGDVCMRFFDERWIDAPITPGKVPGAFCHPTVSSHHPYIMLNFAGKRRDALTLAHELGHGVHQFLGNVQGPFHHNTPLTVAETASVFGETIVFNALLEGAESPSSRFSLLAQKAEDAIATVFRQVAMNQFEDRAHNARRTEGELSIERFGELWYETQSEMLGDSVEITDGYRTWWSYIPHFIHVPGYVYSYAFGQLLALSVYRRYEQQGAAFVDSYIEMLAAGGSKSPEELASIVDCDLGDPAFWAGGLEIIERDIANAEDAAPEGPGEPAGQA